MKKGFTLLELLIVIAILAILAAAAVVVLNPAELLRRARDSERITDIANIRNAMNLYLTTVASIDLDAATAGCQVETTANKLYTHVAAFSSNTITDDGLGGAGSITAVTTRVTDGTGWLPVNLGLTAGGSPLSSLPVDSIADADNWYYYLCSSNSSSTYELGTNMESSEYANAGGGDLESTDGGDADDLYEAGNDSGLDLGA